MSTYTCLTLRFVSTLLPLHTKKNQFHCVQGSTPIQLVVLRESELSHVSVLSTCYLVSRIHAASFNVLKKKTIVCKTLLTPTTLFCWNNEKAIDTQHIGGYFNCDWMINNMTTLCAKMKKWQSINKLQTKQAHRETHRHYPEETDFGKIQALKVRDYACFICALFIQFKILRVYSLWSILIITIGRIDTGLSQNISFFVCTWLCPLYSFLRMALGLWVTVQPLPNTFVVNIDEQMGVLSHIFFIQVWIQWNL
jgi:hypothetical protein